MTDENGAVGRRGFMRAVAGAGAAGALAGRAAAQSSTRPDWGGWLDGVNGGYLDARGRSEVTVQVGAAGNQGNFAFAPAGVWVDPGTTVRWEWTGEGGAHNVVADSGPADLDSGETVDTTGVEYEYTFESGGITTYLCEPHESLGMKGAVAVGDEVPTTEATPTPSPTATSSGNESGSGGGDLPGAGQTEEVVVGPGGSLVFEPAELEILAGTTVEFTWDSDNHNVVVESQPEDADWSGTEGGESQTYNSGHTYSHQFTVPGEYAYYCSPHLSAGMEATITVVEERSTAGGGGGPPQVPDTAKTLGIATMIGMASTLGLAYFFLKYGGDYREE